MPSKNILKNSFICVLASMCWMQSRIYFVVLCILLAACSPSAVVDTAVSEDVPVGENVTYIDGTPYLVDPKKILSSGPPPDGIPSIDHPQFVRVEDADLWIEDNELVLAIIHKNRKRVYPLQIMVWHEIVNDNIAGDPILITYCPLCGSGIAYKPEIEVNGEKKFVEFFNTAEAINTRLHQFELLPGFGRKHTDGILEERNKKLFENLEDLKKRVSNLPDPKKAIEKRILEEITGKERYNLFIGI